MTAERTITETTAKELMSSIGELNTSIAVANTRLQDIAIKFDRQEDINLDIETRMKAREIAAVKSINDVDGLIAWKKTLNGYFLSIGISVSIFVVMGILYLIFGQKP